MELGLGVLQLSPKQFWSYTFPEFYAALDGLRKWNSSDDSARPAGSPDKWSKKQVEETKAFIEDLKTRFPETRAPKGYKKRGSGSSAISARR